MGIDATIATVHKSTQTATIYRTSQTTNGKEMVASIRSQTKFEVSAFQKLTIFSPKRISLKINDKLGNANFAFIPP